MAAATAPVGGQPAFPRQMFERRGNETRIRRSFPSFTCNVARQRALLSSREQEFRRIALGGLWGPSSLPARFLASLCHGCFPCSGHTRTRMPRLFFSVFFSSSSPPHCRVSPCFHPLHSLSLSLSLRLAVRSPWISSSCLASCSSLSLALFPSFSLSARLVSLRFSDSVEKSSVVNGNSGFIVPLQTMPGNIIKTFRRNILMLTHRFTVRQTFRSSKLLRLSLSLSLRSPFSLSLPFDFLQSFTAPPILLCSLPPIPPPPTPFRFVPFRDFKSSRRRRCCCCCCWWYAPLPRHRRRSPNYSSN